MTDHELYERAMDGDYVGELPYLCGILCEQISGLAKELADAEATIVRVRKALDPPRKRGAWIEFASDGKRVAAILHDPKDALMPDSFVWCEEISDND